MATLREISEITGYSIATISRVLNEDETLKVTDSTRKMILDAAGSMDYANKHGGNKKGSPGEHLKIGIVQMEITQESEKDPYYLYLKSNVEKCCFSREMETFVMQYNSEEACYRSAVSRELDGILAIGQFREEQIAAMKKSAPHIVFLDSSPRPEEFCSVVPNYEVGIRQGMKYLVEQGHRRIAFVGPEYSTDSINRQALELRRKFFCDYLERYGDNKIEGILIDTDWLECDISEQILNYMKKGHPKPTAFFAFNETTAMGVLRALQILGFQVPEDFSILSYNDTILATLTQPHLSGIRIHMEEMVDCAVDLLVRNVRGKDSIPLCISVPSTLIIRESVQKAKQELGND